MKAEIFGHEDHFSWLDIYFVKIDMLSNFCFVAPNKTKEISIWQFCSKKVFESMKFINLT